RHRGSLGDAARRHLAADPPARERPAGAVRGRDRLPGRSPRLARRERPARPRADPGPRGQGRRLRLRPDRHGREPPGGHQEPGGLRVPRRPGADPGPRRPGGRLPGARRHAGEEPPGDQGGRAHLRRPVALAAAPGPRRLHARHPAARHRRGAAGPRRRALHRGGPAGPEGPLRPRPGHLRRLRHLPPPRRRGLRAPLGPVGGDVGPPPGPRPVTGRSGTGQGRHAPEEPGAGAPVGAPKPTTAPQGAALWQGRFADAPAEALLEFTESLSFDSRLAADDLAGSRAHIDMLARVGLITEEERAVVAAALTRVEAELDAGTFTFLPLDEDIHTAVERRVTELAGPAGAKLHTGRSRNDQVALDLRLYVRREGRAMAGRLCDLMQVLLRRAAQAHAEDVYLPGYTHMQRAQPVLLAHHLLAHFCALSRDVDRLADALDRADVSPLGAGALAGSTLPLDPASVAAALGFSGTFQNSLDAVSDRDFVAELLFVCALCQVHLSRLGEEVVLWATEEFGFLRLADAYSTGSSMLPQKKNPDIAELVRGKAGRLIGHLTGFLATLKGLPLSY